MLLCLQRRSQNTDSTAARSRGSGFWETKCHPLIPRPSLRIFLPEFQPSRPLHLSIPHIEPLGSFAINNQYSTISTLSPRYSIPAAQRSVPEIEPPPLAPAAVESRDTRYLGRRYAADDSSDGGPSLLPASWPVRQRKRGP
ncbi:uncharacterized protein CC84DRAFT_897829 [Paraphaeosphaeria sporulosa]|uniref:Uncharacterized protein n=1 Tax=Paraphaeosphaeria sporulosa TaxID=1460663 RepID=A0A177C4K3_9PLEO|nr:uncharacterized protein CC84DRAFT_897829 [Paraphaeosphaeria sporulosa]OAG02563.1 hypothetical protein CC84DRAFT_897829 [Paraphaeosphaeria sporulosa]